MGPQLLAHGVPAAACTRCACTWRAAVLTHGVLAHGVQRSAAQDRGKARARKEQSVVPAAWGVSWDRLLAGTQPRPTPGGSTRNEGVWPVDRSDTKLPYGG